MKVIANFLVIVTETGELINFDLSEVRSVRLLDDGTRDDITGFTEASASTIVP